MKIMADDPRLVYCGRIDFEQKEAPEFVYPCSYVSVRFTGTSLTAVVSNRCNYWDNYLGVIIDGQEQKFLLSKTENEKQTLVLGKDLLDTEHEAMLFKRQDSCHMFRFYGFEIDDTAEVLPPPKLPRRRIEVYGDSVSAGEVSEAVAYAGKCDPEHQGEFSNSYGSYAWITARRLNACLHDIAQGGIALMDGTGWFSDPDFIGMESVYDKIQYNPAFGVSKTWDFSKFRPHVVIVAIGQNDSHPQDYMAEDFRGEKACLWRERYRRFIEKLRAIYPKAEIILATTILQHHENWDRSIEEVCGWLEDPKIHHFLYSKNGTGTPGHIRIPEAEQMAEELSGYIEGLGAGIWEDED